MPSLYSSNGHPYFYFTTHTMLDIDTTCVTCWSQLFNTLLRYYYAFTMLHIFLHESFATHSLVSQPAYLHCITGVAGLDTQGRVHISNIQHQLWSQSRSYPILVTLHRLARLSSLCVHLINEVCVNLLTQVPWHFLGSNLSLPRYGAFDLGLAVSVPLPIVTGIFVLLWFQSRLT